MSDHNHAPSVQGSNREIEEKYGWREEARFLKEYLKKNSNTTRKYK